MSEIINHTGITSEAWGNLSHEMFLGYPLSTQVFTAQDSSLDSHASLFFLSFAFSESTELKTIRLFSVFNVMVHSFVYKYVLSLHPSSGALCNAMGVSDTDVNKLAWPLPSQG